MVDTPKVHVLLSLSMNSKLFHLTPPLTGFVVINLTMDVYQLLVINGYSNVIYDVHITYP